MAQPFENQKQAWRRSRRRLKTREREEEGERGRLVREPEAGLAPYARFTLLVWDSPLLFLWCGSGACGHAWPLAPVRLRSSEPAAPCEGMGHLPAGNGASQSLMTPATQPSV